MGSKISTARDASKQEDEEEKRRHLHRILSGENLTQTPSDLHIILTGEVPLGYGKSEKETMLEKILTSCVILTYKKLHFNVDFKIILKILF